MKTGYTELELKVYFNLSVRTSFDLVQIIDNFESVIFQ